MSVYFKLAPYVTDDLLDGLVAYLEDKAPQCSGFDCDSTDIDIYDRMFRFLKKKCESSQTFLNWFVPLVDKYGYYAPEVDKKTGIKERISIYVFDFVCDVLINAYNFDEDLFYEW